MTTQTKQQFSIFPDLPRGKLLDENGYMTHTWSLFFSSMAQSLQTNFKQEGLVIPFQPASNITLLTGTESIGNMLYDSTNNLFKGNVAGTWKTFTLT